MRKQKGDKDFETVRAVEGANQTQDDTITLSSGVVLRGKPAHPLILVQVMAAFPRPEPPSVYIAAMGREMENPDDPNYIERLQNWKMEYADRMVTAMIILGTELVSTPKGMGGPDKDAWLEEYSLFGLPMKTENKNWRYLTWVKFKAVQSDTDMQKIQEVVGRLSGVRESSVQAATDFPGSNQDGR